MNGAAILAVVLAARHAERARHPRGFVPETALVLAVVKHESDGNERACHDEPDGSSSRGLMQIRRPNSRCVPEDDAKYAADYEPAANVREGIARLVAARTYERLVCGHHRDYLAHYCGRGRAAVRLAKEIRTLEKKIRKKGLTKWQTVT